MAWLVRITISDISVEDEKEMTRTLRQLNDRHPKWIAEMRELSRVETRQHLRKRGLSLDSFRGLEVGTITMPPELLAVAQRYGVKLGKALYYMHTNRIVPSIGVVKTFVYPNSDFLSTDFPLDKFNFLTSRPVISRSGKSLESQFAYRFAAAVDGEAAAFLLQFGESTAVLTLVFEDAARYELSRAARLAPDASAPPHQTSPASRLD